MYIKYIIPRFLSYIKCQNNFLIQDCLFFQSPSTFLLQVKYLLKTFHTFIHSLYISFHIHSVYLYSIPYIFFKNLLHPYSKSLFRISGITKMSIIPSLLLCLRVSSPCYVFLCNFQGTQIWVIKTGIITTVLHFNTFEYITPLPVCISRLLFFSYPLFTCYISCQNRLVFCIDRI